MSRAVFRKVVGVELRGYRELSTEEFSEATRLVLQPGNFAYFKPDTKEVVVVDSSGIRTHMGRFREFTPH